MTQETALAVPAKITNDCGKRVAVEFDAAGPLSRLHDDTIVGLALDGFRNSETADSVAWDSEEPAVHAFFSDMETLDRYGYDGGYEVEIDSNAAIAWLIEHRPEAHARIVAEGSR